VRLGSVVAGRWWVVGRVRGRTLVVDLLGLGDELPRGRAVALDDARAPAAS
jgi:hypothetical protein